MTPTADAKGGKFNLPPHEYSTHPSSRKLKRPRLPELSPLEELPQWNAGSAESKEPEWGREGGGPVAQLAGGGRQSEAKGD